MGRQTLILGFLLAAVLSTAMPGPALAQASEQAVKAEFLPRFARYVSWPPRAQPGRGAPVNLCIIGRDPFGQLADRAAATQPAGDHPIRLHRLRSADGASRCHIAFVQGESGQATGQLLAALARWPVLTVTDARHGAQRGMIHFANVGGRVRFFIDDAAAAQRGLGISSRLLALAIGVRERGR